MKKRVSTRIHETLAHHINGAPFYLCVFDVLGESRLDLVRIEILLGPGEGLNLVHRVNALAALKRVH